MHSQELSTCKRIGYELFCEELFVVKSKARYSSTDAIYFDLGADIIKENCAFEFYFNKTNIKPSVPDGWTTNNFFTNWPSYKRVVCSFNNDFLKKYLVIHMSY